MAVKASLLYIFLLFADRFGDVDGFQARELTYYAERKMESVKLYGNIHTYAYWFVDLLVGTPAQRTSVIVDTGSSVCAFSCSACKHCGTHIDKAFDIAASSTATWSSCAADCPSGTCSEDRCSYSVSYSEGSSLSGLWFTDMVQLGDVADDNLATKSYLGCHTSETNLFYSQSAGGILGLAPTKYDKYPTILGSLFSDVRIDKNIFSLCLSSEGGELTVGGHRGNESELNFFPMKTETFYTISLSEIAIGSDSMGTMFAPVVVDSGTTLTYLPPETYKKITEQIEVKISKQGNRCFQTLDHSLFPEISFRFEGSPEPIIWRPTSYLYISREKTLCYGFAPSANSREIVLGGSFFVNRNVVFDLSRGRLGMSHHECPSYTERPEHVLPTTTNAPESTSTSSTTTTNVPSTRVKKVYAIEEVATSTSASPSTTSATTTQSNLRRKDDTVWLASVLMILVLSSIAFVVYRQRRSVSLQPAADPEREQLNIT